MRRRPVTSLRKFVVVLGALAFGATSLARADSTREYAPTPPPAPAPVTLSSAQQKIDAGDFRGAIPILTVIVKADPNNADAANLMGYSLRKTGQTDLAMQYYNRALALMPKHLGTNEYLGELYAELGQIDKAKERLAVLHGACGNCVQAQDLAAFIEKTEKKS
jgi:tetratricopeptide (TPR) repeat protein